MPKRATTSGAAAASAPAAVVAGAEEAGADDQERRAEQRHGCDHTDLERGEAERKQIDRQEDGDEAVAEVAQGARA